MTQNLLQLATREDERPVVDLRTEVLPPGRPSYALSLFLELRPNEIRSWWPVPGGIKEFSSGYHGLREGAPALVELTLPKNSRIRRIEITPKGPP